MKDGTKTNKSIQFLVIRMKIIIEREYFVIIILFLLLIVNDFCHCIIWLIREHRLPNVQSYLHVPYFIFCLILSLSFSSLQTIVRLIISFMLYGGQIKYYDFYISFTIQVSFIFEHERKVLSARVHIHQRDFGIH